MKRYVVTGLDESGLRHWFHQIPEKRIKERLESCGVAEDGRALEPVEFKYDWKTATGHVRKFMLECGTAPQ